MPITNLPIELALMVISELPKGDIKQLRLSCSFFRDIARPRFVRVFLSANPLNVKVFLAVADHNVFRNDVREIIIDDARLSCPSFSSSAVVPQWFEDARSGNIRQRDRRRNCSKEHQEPPMPSADAWAYYLDLKQQQDEVVKSAADVHALQHGLRSFPNLSRITITPAAHGWLNMPAYPTPMIRAFPHGFNYFLPRGWPHSGEKSYESPFLDDEISKGQWRGLGMVLQALAAPRLEHQISEFVVDTRTLDTGLPDRIFARESEAFKSFSATLRIPGLRHLDLAFCVSRDIGERERPMFVNFESGLLRQSLCNAVEIEHFRLRTDFMTGHGRHDERARDRSFPSRSVSLRNILPVEKWSCLKHFGLSGFYINQHDLVSILAALPDTLRSVELSFLYFACGQGDHRALLSEMRSALAWGNRPVYDRPIVSIGMEYWLIQLGRVVWVREEVGAFLYGDGPNPFGKEGESYPDEIRIGFGVQREFDTDFERPNLMTAELIRLGYLDGSPSDYEDWDELPSGSDSTTE